MSDYTVRGGQRRDAATPRILAVLLPYLDAKDNEWCDQSGEDRRPTLPSTKDGKVNVRAIVAEIAGLNAADEQHFFKKIEIAGPVNVIARAQGLKPIGSRVLEDAEDDAARVRHKQDAKRNKELSADLLEAEAKIAELTERVRQLEAQLELRTQTGLTLPPETVTDA
jgi:hypothetical protein